MLKTYELACNIDIMCSPRITIAKGRFETSDPHVQRVIGHYPGVTFVSERPDEPIGIGTSFAHVESVVVTNSCGLQMKEKRPASARESPNS
jgi:hypothetical protein